MVTAPNYARSSNSKGSKNGSGSDYRHAGSSNDGGSCRASSNDGGSSRVSSNDSGSSGASSDDGGSRRSSSSDGGSTGPSSRTPFMSNGSGISQKPAVSRSGGAEERSTAAVAMHVR
ncbi:hypothetical protein MTO96_042590 [Rhipicephalus appendiculatus]